MSIPMNDSFALFPPTQTRVLLGTDKFAILVVHMSTSFLGIGLFLPITLYQGFYKKDYVLTKGLGAGTLFFTLGSAVTGFLLNSFGSLFETAHGLAVITLFCGFCMILLKIAIGTFQKRDTCITTAIHFALLFFSLFAELTGFITMPLGSYTIPIMIAFASYHILSMGLFFYSRGKKSMPLRISLAEKKASLATFVKQRNPTQFEIQSFFKKVHEQKESRFSVNNPLHHYFSQKSKEQFRLKKLSEKHMI